VTGHEPTTPPVPPAYRVAALVAFAVIVGLGLLPPDDRGPLAVAGAVVAVGAAAPLFLRPGPRTLVLAVPAAAGVVVAVHGRSGSLGWFGLCLLGGWIALLARRPWGLTALGVGLAVFAAEWATEPDPGWGAWATGLGLTVGSGLLARHQLGLIEELRRLQHDLAQRSRAEERNRIARDIHDVIAHSLTVSLLHVSSARLAVEHEPEVAARALDDAERLTRQSLMDVRATVGFLGSDGTDGATAPLPSLDELPRLVADLRAARAEVELELEGDLDTLTATTGSTAYRIVQESLTNASRHARGAPVRVRVARHAGLVDVSVWSGGPPGRGEGMGLQNMRDRAEAVGGVLDAGPAEGGWLVHATLPQLDASPAAAR
jgi:signal transduction histidine kinase